MGLVKCPDCNHDVSDIAPVCIHCGRPKPWDQPKKVEEVPAPPVKKKPRPDVVLTLAGGVLLCVGLASLIGGLPGAAGLSLLVGLCAIVAGGLWSWLKRD